MLVVVKKQLEQNLEIMMLCKLLTDMHIVMDIMELLQIIVHSARTDGKVNIILFNAKG